MRVLVAYFSQMGRSGCGEDPTFLLATLQKHISSWEGFRWRRNAFKHLESGCLT